MNLLLIWLLLIVVATCCIILAGIYWRVVVESHLGKLVRLAIFKALLWAAERVHPS
jgi:hypothetical protein